MEVGRKTRRAADEDYLPRLVAFLSPTLVVIMLGCERTKYLLISTDLLIGS